MKPEVFLTCRPPLPHERLARWELRMGHYKSSERMRLARVHQAIDAIGANTAHAPFQPKLPQRIPA